MAQGLIGGATSYEEQSLKDILDDIVNWIFYTEDRKNFLFQGQQKLVSKGYWDSIPYDFQVTVNSSIVFCSTIVHDLNIVKTAIETNSITQREVALLKNIGIKAHEYNCEYPLSFRENRFWHDYDNPNFRIAENIYARGRDFFVTLQDAVNAAHRLEDYMDNRNIVNNTLNFAGDVSNTQIQQGTTNSTQTMATTADFDYDAVLTILKKIENSFESPDFQDDFGDKAETVKTIVADAIESVNKREKATKIKVVLNDLKNLAIGVSGSLIASGICGLLEQLPL